MGKIEDDDSNRNELNILNSLKNDLLIKSESKQEKDHSNAYGLLLFSLSTSIHGSNSFQIKYMSVYFANEYNGYVLGFWRSLAVFLISLGLLKYKDQEIQDVRKVENRLWFCVRTAGQFLGFITYVFMLDYFRISTAACISSMTPVVIALFCTVILKEKFYTRYLVGIIICFIGSSMIILNDKTQSASSDTNANIISEQNDESPIFNILCGSFIAIINLVIMALISISTKFLLKENISQENQCLYLGLSNTVLSFICIILKGGSIFSSGVLFIMSSLLNGAIFLVSVLLLIECLRWVDLSKTTPLAYLNTLTVFTLGVTILGEPLFVTDIIGSLFILGFNVLNSLKPVE